VIIRVQAA
jgi:hypothetical protein